MLAKRAAETVRNLEDDEMWMSGGGVMQWVKRRKKEYLEGGMGTEGSYTNYCRLWGGKGLGSWWDNKVGRGVDATCPRCGWRKTHWITSCSGAVRSRE